MSQSPRPNSKPFIKDICGPINTADMLINKVSVQALIDTGSSVSTITDKLCKSLKLTLQPLKDIVQVESATGHILQYKGYVECTYSAIGLNLPDNTGLFLVVPETPFSANVPVIVGTNLLNCMTPTVRTQEPSTNPWKMAFQCLALQDGQIRRNEGVLGL